MNEDPIQQGIHMKLQGSNWRSLHHNCSTVPINTLQFNGRCWEPLRRDTDLIFVYQRHKKKFELDPEVFFVCLTKLI